MALPDFSLLVVALFAVSLGLIVAGPWLADNLETVVVTAKDVFLWGVWAIWFRKKE